jgi:hypothetical protein
MTTSCALPPIKTLFDLEGVPALSAAISSSIDPLFVRHRASPDPPQAVANAISSAGERPLIDKLRGRVPAAEVREFIHEWAWPIERSPLLLAMQFAAEEQFGLPCHRALYTSPTIHAAREELRRRGPQLRSFLLAAYEQTQVWLKANGLDEVWVWRGLTLLTPREANAHGLELFKPQLTPLSSWTPNYQWAKRIALRERRVGGLPGGRMLLAEIPRERVASMFLTGYGGTGVFEIVVIGGPAIVWSVCWPTRDDPLAAISEAEYLQLIAAAGEDARAGRPIRTSLADDAGWHW